MPIRSAPARALTHIATPGARLFDAPGWTPGPFATLAIALAATGIPVALHVVGMAAGLAACVGIALLIANFAASALPITLISSYLFQNLFVSLVSPAVTDMDQFNSIRAYNFVLTATTWLVASWGYWTARARFNRRFCILMDVTTVALISIGLYFVVGLAANPSGAIIYLRNIAAPFLLLQVFAIVAYRYRVSPSDALVAIAIFALAYGYVEFLAYDRLMSLVNGDTYLYWRTRDEAGRWLKELHETGRVMRSYLDGLSINFLNTPLLRELGWSTHRLLGPNFHFISFAYALAFFSIVLAALGRWWYALLALPLLLVIGSKGALILAVLVTAALVALPYLRRSTALWSYVAVLACYAVAGIVAGIRMQDYHVIGFVGGVLGLISNPAGRGIGVGGNLAVEPATIDWARSQHLGHIDPVVESAVGVLLYQMGVLAVIPLGVLVWLARRLWRLYTQSHDRMFAAGAFAVLTVTVNGIFQEEALFSPLALGIVVAFAGLLLGRGYRNMAATDVDAKLLSAPLRLQPR